MCCSPKTTRPEQAAASRAGPPASRLRGRGTPPFHSDIIAKKVYSPDLHPYRLSFLLRGISGDETIEVASSASNEPPHQASQSKAMILGITTWLRDRRLADLEVQKAAREFIFTRGDPHASDMPVLQYPVDKGQPKGELTYGNVKEAPLAVLMVESPDVFKAYDATSDRHIHRFTRMAADAGLSHEMKAKVMYVQCDKCLAQLRDGTNAESADGAPDRLQVWLASFADPNAPEALAWAASDPELKDMMGEATAMAQEKEVRAMLAQERYDRMDWLSYGAEREARGEERGEVNAYLKLVRSGAISVETAASSLGVTTADFTRKYMMGASE